MAKLPMAKGVYAHAPVRAYVPLHGKPQVQGQYPLRR
jgi:hypothetical protein